MKKITVQDIVKFIYVSAGDLRIETVKTLNTHFAKEGNLYGILCYDEDLRIQQIQISLPCWMELEQLRSLCNKHDACYVRIDFPCIPGPDRNYTPAEREEISRVAIVLSDSYIQEVHARREQGYIDAVDIIEMWAKDFINVHGIDAGDDDTSWDDIVISWGEEQLKHLIPRSSGAHKHQQS